MVQCGITKYFKGNRDFKILLMTISILVFVGESLHFKTVMATTLEFTKDNLKIAG